MNHNLGRCLTALLLLITTDAYALDPQPGDLYVRVVDVGAGECCVIRIPADDPDDNHYIIFDAGNFEDDGDTAMAAIEELIPDDERIDLLVLSHTDSDHTAAVPRIVDEYFIDRILRTGSRRFGNFPQTLRDARAAVERAVDEDETLDLNLNEVEFPPGATYRFGDAFVTFVAGFGEIPDDFDVSGNSEKNNAPSIVIRVQFQGRSILFCGDAVGRHNGDADQNALIATERFMVEQQDVVKIDSDVIVAPHHGADNGSSTAFIQAVSPEFVVFSAGHKFEHPRAVAAQRYLNNGVMAANMFRTDRGDDEGAVEWNHERVADASDEAGDDDVDIVIRANGGLDVAYRQP